MSRLAGSILLFISLTVPVFADVTLKESGQMKAGGRSNPATSVTYITGHKMRVETAIGDNTYTTIVDLDAAKLFSFDSKKKEAEVWDLAAFSQAISKSADASRLKATVTPNGQTKPVQGATAAAYDLNATIPEATDGGTKMNGTVAMVGTLWIVKNAPGSADYAAFFRAAADKGFSFANPGTAKAQPGRTKALIELYRLVAELGGVPFETTWDVKVSAGMMSGMMNTAQAMTLTSVDTATLSADLFAPPPDYKLIPKK